MNIHEIAQSALQDLFTSPTPEPRPHKTKDPLFPKIAVSPLHTGVLSMNSGMTIRVSYGRDRSSAYCTTIYECSWNTMSYAQDHNYLAEELWASSGTTDLDYANIFLLVTDKSLLPREWMTANFQSEIQDHMTKNFPHVFYSDDSISGTNRILTFHVYLG